MAASSTSTHEPSRRRWRLLGRWQGFLGNMRRQPRAAAAIIGACLAIIGGAVYWGVLPQVAAYRAQGAARRAVAEFDFLRAKESFARCLEVWPNSALTHFEMARACRRAVDFDAARLHYKQAEALGWFKQQIDVEYLLIQAQVGNLGGVEETLLNYLDARHPDEQLIFEALVKGYLHTFRLSEAMERLNAWIDLDPDNWQARFWRGFVYQRLKSAGMASHDFRRALQYRPDHPESHLRLAQLLTATGEYPEALGHYRRCAELQPDDPAGLIGIARCQRSLSDQAGALATLDKLFASHPKHPLGHLVRGQLAVDQDQPQEALTWLQRAWLLAPYEVDVNFNLAKAYRALQRNAEGEKFEQETRRLEKDLRRIESITEAIMHRPKEVGLRQEAGTILLRSGQEKEGLRWLYSALQEDPNHAATHETLAQHYEKIGDVPKAQLHRQRLQRAAPPPTHNSPP